MMISTMKAVLATAVLVGGLVHGQTVSGLDIGAGTFGRLGHDCTFVGDLNGDGVADYVASALNEGFVVGQTSPGYGLVRVYSGSNHSVLGSIPGNRPDLQPLPLNARLGTALAPFADLDGDGTADFAASIASSSSPGRVVVFSGATLSIIAQATRPNNFGSALASVGDVDGDGVPDLLAAGGGPTIGFASRGEVALYSGASLAPLLSAVAFPGTTAGELFGARITGAGDLDGDGRAEIAVTVIATGSLVGNRVEVFRFDPVSATLSPFRTYICPAGCGFVSYPTSVANVGDLDGDAVDELAISATRTNGDGVVFVHSGQTGAVLRQLVVPGATGTFGLDMDASDVSGNGVPDVIVGEPVGVGVAAPGDGRIHVFSGASGLSYYRIDTLQGGDQLGYSISAGPDLDGDGFGDFIAGAPMYGAGAPGSGQSTSEGAVAAFSGLIVASVSTVGQGCGAPSVHPVLSMTLPRFGSQVLAAITNTLPGTAGSIVITGTPPLPSPLTVGSCSIAIDPSAIATATWIPFLTNGAGIAVVSAGVLPVPTPALAGVSLRAQAYVLPAIGPLVSNGLEARIGG